MKKAFVAPKILLSCLALGLIGVGTWTVRRERGSAPSAAKPADLLAAIPSTTGHSLSDQEVARWTEKARQNPKEETAWTNLGDALMQRARETADLSDYGHAESAYQKALALNPKNGSATTGMAWVNGGRHAFEKSIEWANKALALDPLNTDAYGLIGDARTEMGDYDAAFDNYQKMLDIHPNLSAYSRGAHLLWLTGDTRKALFLMAKAIQAGGPYAENTAWCRARLGLMLANEGALPAAEQTLQAALKQTPNNYQVLAALGKVKAARKEVPAAIEFYKRAIAVVPQHDTLVALGDLYMLTGKPDEAQKQYRLVETIHTLQKANGVTGDAQIAQFYADHDRNLPEALQTVQAEYATRKNVYVADTLAWCYYKNGQVEQARDAIKIALSKRTPEPLFSFHAGMIYAKLGDRPTAQLCLSRALSQNPAFSPIYARLATDTLHALGTRPPAAPLVAAHPVSGQNSLPHP